MEEVPGMVCLSWALAAVGRGLHSDESGHVEKVISLPCACFLINEMKRIFFKNPLCFGPLLVMWALVD